MENDISWEEKVKRRTRCEQRVNIFYRRLRQVVTFSTNDQSSNRISSLFVVCLLILLCFAKHVRGENDDDEEEEGGKMKNVIAQESMGKHLGKSQVKSLLRFRSNKQKKKKIYWRVSCLRLNFASACCLMWSCIECWHASCHDTSFWIINQIRQAVEGACGLTTHWTLLNDFELNCRWMNAMRHELIII